MTREVAAKLAEIEQQTPESKIREKEDLEEGLKALNERIQPMPGPEVSQSVWDGMRDRTEWPLLDAATASALSKYCDSDLFPEEAMFTLGEFFSSSLSTEEIKRWIPIVSGEYYRIRLSRPQADLVAYLAFEFWESLMEADDHNLVHSGRWIMRRPVEELKHVAEEDGLAGTGSKAELVLRLVEHFYSDVLVPVCNSS